MARVNHAKVAIVVSVGIICSSLIAHFSTSRRAGAITTSTGIEIVLNVIPSTENRLINVVRIYARSPKDNIWRWYYVDHESPFSSWWLTSNEADGSVLIKNFFGEVGRLNLTDGSYHLRGRFHSYGEFQVIGPIDSQGEVVNRVKLPKDKWGWN